MGHETEPGFGLPETSHNLDKINADLASVETVIKHNLAGWLRGPDFNEYFLEDTETLRVIAEKAGQLAISAEGLSSSLEVIRQAEEIIPDTSNWSEEIIAFEDIPKIRHPEGKPILIITIIGPRDIKVSENYYHIQRDSHKMEVFNILAYRLDKITTLADARRYNYYSDAPNQLTRSSNWSRHGRELETVFELLQEGEPIKVIERVSGDQHYGYGLRINPQVEFRDERVIPNPLRRRRVSSAIGLQRIEANPTTPEEQLKRFLLIQQSASEYVVNGTGQMPIAHNDAELRAIKKGLTQLVGEVNFDENPEIMQRWKTVMCKVTGLTEKDFIPERKVAKRGGKRSKQELGG
jgi:hypothetical protein